MSSLWREAEIKWTGGVEREEKRIRERRAAKVIADRQQAEAVAWMDANRSAIGTVQWRDKMKEIFGVASIPDSKK
ncbi:MAG: hypothetical protein NTY53_23665 [Kiritimatiellaeota bacterium]|nr:hypothetical protein [Kiritimatiellota bacterium]